MAVIDPSGLFNGQRLGACSDLAQLYYPRLYCAANGWARLEIRPTLILGRCFRSFKQPPTEDQLWTVLKEYVENFLAIPYRADGQLWIQFDTAEKYLKRRKTTEDDKSPSPPSSSVDAFKAGYAKWKQTHAETNPETDFGNLSETFTKSVGNAAAIFSPGIGRGNGIGFGEVHTSLADVVNESKKTEPNDESIPVTVNTDNSEIGPTPPPAYESLWNSHCAPLQPIRAMTAKRRARLRVLEKQGLTEQRFLAAIAHLKGSPFCCGQGPNGWRASFDWLIDGDNLQRVLEGQFAKPSKSVMKHAESYKELARA